MLVDTLPTGVRQGPFIGLHIRRGDKLIREAKLIETKVYLEEAFAYLNKSVYSHAGNLPAECSGRRTPLPAEVLGIHVASDDLNVVEEVKELAPKFFESVVDIVYISAGTGEFEKKMNIPTQGYIQTYWSTVYLLVDMQQLVNANLFVGIFLSSIGRMVYLLRSQNAAIGVEPNFREWRPTH
ncbi:unnamed protein product [Choristocarpus tenellus]